MATVRDVLEQKGREVYHIHPDASVLTALEMMAKHHIGALVVIEGGNLTGIITERDYARKIVLKGRTSPRTLVREIMSTTIICTRLDQTVEECMAIMTAKAVRHLPVLEHTNAYRIGFDRRFGQKRHRRSKVHYRAARTLHPGRPLSIRPGSSVSCWPPKIVGDPRCKSKKQKVGLGFTFQQAMTTPIRQRLSSKSM